LIVAAPAYFFGAYGSLKSFLDRGLAFYKHADKIWKKPAVAIAVAGMDGKAGRTQLDLEGILMGMGAIRKKSALVYGALPGEALLNETNKQIAKDCGKALFAEEIEENEICCSLCGSQSFRFSTGNKVRCLLCSHEGTIEMEAGVPHFKMKKGHDIMLTNDAAADHGKWLMGMKQRFHEMKDQLKEVRIEYQDDGTWVKPNKETV